MAWHYEVQFVILFYIHWDNCRQIYTTEHQGELLYQIRYDAVLELECIRTKRVCGFN